MPFKIELNPEMMVCPDCAAEVPLQTYVCTDCGHIFETVCEAGWPQENPPDVGKYPLHYFPENPFTPLAYPHQLGELAWGATHSRYGWLAKLLIVMFLLLVSSVMLFPVLEAFDWARTTSIE